MRARERGIPFTVPILLIHPFIPERHVFPLNSRRTSINSEVSQISERTDIILHFCEQSKRKIARETEILVKCDTDQYQVEMTLSRCISQVVLQEFG